MPINFKFIHKEKYKANHFQRAAVMYQSQDLIWKGME